jgi:hypothetical protein
MRHIRVPLSFYNCFEEGVGVVNRVENVYFVFLTGKMFKRPVSITSLKNQVMTSIIIGLSVFLILVVFQPFGTFGFRMSHKTLFLAGYGVICTSLYIIYYAFVMSLFKKWFAPLSWNILKEIVTLLPALFLISFASLWYHHRFGIII